MRRAIGESTGGEGVHPGREVERVEDELARKVGARSWPDAEVAVPRHRRVTRRVAAPEAPHGDALEAAAPGPGCHRAVVGVTRGEVGHAHAREPAVLAHRRVWEREQGIHGHLVGAELRRPLEVGDHLSGRLAGEREHDVGVDTREAASREPGECRLRDLRRVAAADRREVPGVERLDAQRDERDARLVQAAGEIVVHVGRVGLDADVAGDEEALPHADHDASHALQRQCRRAPADVDTRHLDGPDGVGPAVCLGQRGALVGRHQLRAVADLGVRAVRARVAAEGDVQVQRGAPEPGRDPTVRRRREHPALARADEVAARGPGHRARDAGPRCAHR